MNPKTTLMLVVALILAVIGVWLAQPAPKSTEKTVETGPKKLFELTADDIKAFEIKQGDAATCSFVKEDSKWKMTAPITCAAEQFAVNGDVGKVVGLEYTRVYNDGKGETVSDELTSLNKPHKIIKLTDKDGKSHVVKIGSGQKLSTKTYVQIEGDPKIYLVTADLSNDLKRKPSEYRGKRVAEFKTAEAVRIQVAGSENFTLAKSDSGWTVEEPVKARADLTLVNKILNGVANLNALQFVEDEPKSLRPYGLESPRLTVAITTEKKTPKETVGPTSQPADVEYDVTTATVSIALGGAAEDRVFARMIEPAENAVFQVNQTLLKDLAPAVGDLRDKRITSADINKASKIQLKVGGESLSLVKDGAQWKIAGSDGTTPVESAEYAAVDDLLKALRDAKALGFEDARTPAMGLDNPAASIAIDIAGETAPVKLTIGGQTPSKTGVYVANELDGTVAVIATAAADSLSARPISFRSREILTFDSSNATGLTIASEGLTRSIEKKLDGWAMTAPVSGPAESANIEKILADLSALRGRRVVGTSADAATFGFGPGATKVTLTLTPPAPASQPADATPPSPVTHEILFSKHDDKSYAMKVGADVICEVDAKIIDDLHAELLATKLLTFEPSAITSVAIGGANAFTLEKKADTWKLAGESSFAVDAAKVLNLLNALRDLHAKRYVSYTAGNPAEFQLDAPATTITIKDDKGAQHQLNVSATIPTEGGRYASLAAMPDRILVIGPDDVTKILKKVTDFQK